MLYLFIYLLLFSLGLKSFDQVEDVVLVCYKKTEFLGLLLEEFERIHKHRNIVTYLPNNTFQLRIGCNPETSCIVSTKIMYIIMFLYRNCHFN